MKTREQLFDEWRELGQWIADLGTIIQNAPLSASDLDLIEEWIDNAHIALGRFSVLINQTRDIILNATKH